MGLKDNAKALIDANVYANGQEQITGQGLNATLKGMVDILPTTDEILTGINGTATESNAPNTAAGFFRYIVTTPITTGSAWGIEVTQAELDDNWVFFNVKDGVITKDSKPQQGGKSAYELAVEAGFSGTESEWLDSLNGEDGADGIDGKTTEQWTAKAFTANSAVTHQNKLWINTAPAVAGDVPGISSLWIPRIDTGIRITNLVPNGDFSNGTNGWTSWQSSNSVTDGVLTNTGTGTGGSGNEISASAIVGARIVGHKYYFRANVVSKNAVCQRIRIITPQHATVENPVMNTPYLMSGIYTATNTNNTLGISHVYASLAETVGKSIEVDNVMYINLTQSFGAGKEPTKEEMDALIDFVGYWEADGLSRNQIYQWQNNVIKNNKAEVTQLRTDLGVKVKNIAPNGDASNGLTGWSFGGSTNSLAGGVVVNTGNGTANEPSVGLATDPIIIGNKYYAKVNVTVKSANSTQLRMRTNQNFQVLANPVINTPYILSGVITATATTSGIGIYHAYPTAADANGKSIEVDNLVYIDLTAAFGAGKEPTKAQMDILTSIAPYWEGDTLSRNAILRWQRELMQTVDISSKADHGYTGGETIKTLKQVEAIAVASAGQTTTIFEASVDLEAGVDTVIPYNKFSPVLTKRPANIQVVHNDEVKNVTAKYLSNGDNFDIKLNSATALAGAEISVIGSKIDTAKADVGDILVWNNTTNQKQFIKADSYSGADSGLIPLGVVFHREDGKAYILPKDDQGVEVQWASAFKAKMQGFDFATGGTFTITVNATTTAAISYTNADTLTTVAGKINTAINAGADNSELKNWAVTADSANNVVVLVRNWYRPIISTLTVTDASSKVTRTILNGDKQSDASGYTTMHPSLLRNDGTEAGEAGLNWERFYSYLYSGGYDLYNQTTSDIFIIRYARFNTTDNPALVAYWGDGEIGYERYLRGKMAKYPFAANVIALKNGKINTDALAAVTYTDVDGSTKPTFPAAYVAKTFGVTVAGQTTGLEAGAWWLPSVYEMYFMFHQRKTDGTDSVNVALTKIGGTKLNNANIAFWSCSEWAASSTNAFANYGSSGRYSGMNKFSSKNGTIPLHVRAITAVQL